MPGCCAFGCSNRSEGGYSMKKFPKDPVRRKMWYIKVRRVNWVPTTGSFLCEAHFDDDQWEIKENGKRQLKRDAVPTIFHHSPFLYKKKPPFNKNVLQNKKLVEPESDQQNKKLGTPPIVQSVQLNEKLVKPPIVISVQYNEKLGKPLIVQSVTQNENLGKSPIDLTIRQNVEFGKSPFDQSFRQNEEFGKSPIDQSVQQNVEFGKPPIDQSVLQNAEPKVTDEYENQKNKSNEQFINEMTKLKQELTSAHETITKLRMQNISLKLKLRVKAVQLCRFKKSRVRKYGDIFNEDQLEAIQRKNMAFKNWSNKTIETALDLRLSCGKKGYDKLLQLKLPYPSHRTLQRRLQNSKPCEENSTLCSAVSENTSFLLNNKSIMPCFSMISITEGVQSDQSTNSYLGKADHQAILL